jgi:hypothetical protein
MFSSSKAVTAIALATIAQRGLLDYSARVADYWPDFAHNQKGELRHGGLLRPAWNKVSTARIFKLLWSPGIDSKESSLPAFVACAGIFK